MKQNRSSLHHLGEVFRAISMPLMFNICKKKYLQLMIDVIEVSKGLKKCLA
jgi:hypothetical protein